MMNIEFRVSEIKSLMSLKLSHVGSKTRSLGQILGKPCVSVRGHIFQSETHETFTLSQTTHFRLFQSLTVCRLTILNLMEIAESCLNQ